MSKAKKPPKPRSDRGDRYCMILELERGDNTKLEALVERYQDVLGGAAKSNKAFVIRQLIRNAHTIKELPPVRR